jgi:hypothetical protein
MNGGKKVRRHVQNNVVIAMIDNRDISSLLTSNDVGVMVGFSVGEIVGYIVGLTVNAVNS